MSAMFLEDSEVTVLTGRKFKSLQVDQLRRMGIPFFVNALGRAVVARAAIEGRGMPATPAAPVRQPWVPKVLKAK